MNISRITWHRICRHPICRQRICLVMAMLVLSLLPACSQRPDDRTEDGRVIVTYWEKWTGFEAEAMQAVIDDFNASQDRIFVDMLAVSQIDQKVLLATAGGNPPDIAGLWAPQVNVYSEKNALTPLNSRLEAAGIREEDYLPAYWRLCEHKGFVWALPSTPASLALHWNKKMFRDAGLDPDQPPRSLAELDEFAEKLTIVSVKRNGETQQIRFRELTEAERTNYDFNIIDMGFLPSEPGWWSPMWGFWFGADLMDGHDKITCNTPENLAAFEWYRSYTKKFGIDNVRKFGSTFGNFASPQNPFLAGNLAMVLQGVWMFNFIDKYAPTLEWAAAPFPSNDPEKLAGVSLADCDVLVIPKGARHVDEAFEFIRYVNSQEPIEKLTLGQRKFSPLKNVSDDFVKNHPNPFIQTFIDLAASPNIRMPPPTTVWTEYSTELTVAIDRIYNLMEEPEAALSQVQERAQWKLDRVNRRWSQVQEARLEQWSEIDDIR